MRYVGILAVLCFIDFCLFGFSDKEWERVSGIQEPDIRGVVTNPADDKIIYAFTEKSLYRSEDNGGYWMSVFSMQGDGECINFTGVSGQGAFMCAKNGLFRSEDGKSNWKKIFTGTGEKENNVSCIAFSKDGTIFLGTKKGLFISADSGLTWKKSSGETGNLCIRRISLTADTVFIAAEKGLYKNSGAGWKRTFITGREDAEYDADIADEGAETIKPINSIFIDKEDVFLATDSGIFLSEDTGETWKEFTSTGLLSAHVRRILCGDTLYAATDKGIFVYSKESKTWQALYKGMDTKNTRDMAIDKEGDIWVATKNGLYKFSVSGLTITNPDTGLREANRILEGFKNEPNIKDVQNAAIEYAEVHPDKIKEWRSAANKKALLPNVSVGADRYVTDYWHWDSGTNPDTLQKGKDAVSWDVTMTWDMSELIWNNDQTSIDTRSKLMVELRNDIIDEVTRAYFERRRLQAELLIFPPGDLKPRLEKELRLQELTADIDALTGGYFTAHIM